MRDPNRMEPFLEQVRVEWAKYPDFRFGQMLCNFIAEYGSPFYWDEDMFIEKLRTYMNKITGGD